MLALLADYVVRRNSPKTSAAALIPLIWIVIAGSRPLSTWFDQSIIDSPEALFEGSPADRLLYQVLILLSVVVLLRRRAALSRLVSSNGLLLAYFLYLLLGSLWSDYPLIAAKRWVKDVGNLLVVLVLVTERDPLIAARTVMLRAACFLIPASLVLIKYFPEYSRYFDRYSGRGFYSGVALDKNLLGMSITALLGILLWSFFEGLSRTRGYAATCYRIVCFALFAVGVWLLELADCATAIACGVAGMSLHILLLNRLVRQHIALSAVVASLFVVALASSGLLSDIKELSAGALQRDSSLTGRDEIWRIVLSEDINPLIGAGSYTFWMPERMERLSQGFASPFNSAHNGFIDIYLNVGLIGAGLLVSVLIGGVLRLARNRDQGVDWSVRVGIVFLATCAIYASTEAVFNRLNLLWIGILVFLVCSPRQPEPQDHRAALPTK